VTIVPNKQTDAAASGDDLPLVVQAKPNLAWLGAREEESILEPDRPILDPHHHFSAHWGGYFADDFLKDAGSGHRIVATVHVQCGQGYRTSGPVSLAPVGETESVVRSLPRESPTRLCAGIVGYADFTLGDDVQSVLEAHIEAGNGRFRGIRCSGARDETFRYGVLPRPPAHLYRDDRFRSGFARLAPLGLSFDSWCFHHQLDDVLDLARTFPETQIVLNHVGGPLGVGAYRSRRASVLGEWRTSIQELSKCSNISVKLGGLGMAVIGLDLDARKLPPSSEELASAWRPCIEPCIEFFGAARCMFESNFPVDKGSCSYTALWNAFKRLASGASAHDKSALFHDTARSFYRL
jgi:L-fuconolactonase